MARNRGRGRTVDYKAWLGMTAVDLTTASAGTNIGGRIDFIAPGTILRYHGYVQAHMDATKVADDTIVLGFALGIVSTDAAAVGGVSIPDAFGDPDYPWLWHGTMFLQSELAAAAESWGLSAQRLEVDTKAMRRFKPGESLVWSVESATVAGAPATHMTTGFGRVLIGT